MKTKRKISFLVALILMSACLYGQQSHFIYIQTENRQAFYVRQDRKVFSSSGSGYLIIPKLAEGSYDFSIGFPRNEWPELKVTITVDKKDAGFMLKNFGDKGWGLFNLQTMAVIMGVKKESQAVVLPTEGKTDEFSNVLANVVNDPSIRQPAVQTDPVLEEKPVQPAVIPEKALVTEIISLSKKTENNQAQLVYVDIDKGVSDTVRIFIPIEAESLAVEPKPVVLESPAVTEPAQKEEKKKEESKPEGKFIDIELPNPNSKTVSTRADTVISEKKGEDNTTATSPRPVLINSDCKKQATEEDFLKLRKKMAAEEKEDDMVSAAKKFFKSRCFTVEQVKNLSVLFLKDEGKYKFFDAAYPFVSDSYKFSGLESQLKEEYFISRFRAMVKH